MGGEWAKLWHTLQGEEGLTHTYLSLALLLLGLMYSGKQSNTEKKDSYPAHPVGNGTECLPIVCAFLQQN